MCRLYLYYIDVSIHRIDTLGKITIQSLSDRVSLSPMDELELNVSKFYPFVFCWLAHLSIVWLINRYSERGFKIQSNSLYLARSMFMNNFGTLTSSSHDRSLLDRLDVFSNVLCCTNVSLKHRMCKQITVQVIGQHRTKLFPLRTWLLFMSQLSLHLQLRKI